MTQAVAMLGLGVGWMIAGMCDLLIKPGPGQPIVRMVCGGFFVLAGGACACLLRNKRGT